MHSGIVLSGGNIARALRVISIAFPMSTPSVVNESTLATQRALFDFDVVVVRPYRLSRSSRGRDDGTDYASAKAEMTNKAADFAHLLDQGGVLVVILDTLDIIQYNSGQYSYTSGTLYTVTNYDFLDDQIHHKISNGRGDRLTITRPGEPFSAVLRSSEVAWTAFFSGIPAYPLNSLDIFAVNGAGSFIGAISKAFSGHIVFLPNFKHLDEKKFLEACSEYRFGREGTPAPDWVDKVYIPGLADSLAAVRTLNDEINWLQSKRDELLKASNMIASHKKLLLEKGKIQLEPEVRKALDLLGFGTTESEHIPGTNFEIDGRTTVGTRPGILEVKGSKNQIALDEFSPFVVKLLEDFKHKGAMSKGILVGNGLCEEVPNNRLGERVFSPHVLGASDHKFCCPYKQRGTLLAHLRCP